MKSCIEKNITLPSGISHPGGGLSFGFINRKIISNIYSFFKQEWVVQNLGIHNVTPCQKCGGTGMYDNDSYCSKCKGTAWIGLEENKIFYLCRCSGIGCVQCGDQGVVDWIGHMKGRINDRYL